MLGGGLCDRICTICQSALDLRLVPLLQLDNWSRGEGRNHIRPVITVVTWLSRFGESTLLLPHNMEK